MNFWILQMQADLKSRRQIFLLSFQVREAVQIRLHIENAQFVPDHLILHFLPLTVGRIQMHLSQERFWRLQSRHLKQTSLYG